MTTTRIDFALSKPRARADFGDERQFATYEVDLEQLSSGARQLASQIRTTDNDDDLSWVTIESRSTWAETRRRQIVEGFERVRADYEAAGTEWPQWAEDRDYQAMQRALAQAERQIAGMGEWANQRIRERYIWPRLQPGETPEAYFERCYRAITDLDAHVVDRPSPGAALAAMRRERQYRCAVCGTAFTAKAGTRYGDPKYCSPKCKLHAYRQRQKERS